jgi:hypothetical protein
MRFYCPSINDQEDVVDGEKIWVMGSTRVKGTHVVPEGSTARVTLYSIVRCTDTTALQTPYSIRFFLN